jgi:rod shape determining protein RodA
VATLTERSWSREHPASASKRFDWWLLAATLLMLSIGLVSLYSVTFGRDQPGIFYRQVVRIIIGLGPFAVFWLINPGFWQKIVRPLYVINVVMLALVLALGSTGGGAQRWLQIGPLEFQPSELAKLLTVLTLAAFFAGRQKHIKKISTFALSFVHIAVPLLLIFKQPHLGGALVILAIWLSISVIVGVPSRFILTAIALALGAFVFAYNTPGLLKPYHKSRINALIMGGDEQGNAYQAVRAQIAFGVGGVMGTGLGNGEQKQAGYIPLQHNDFIFTVIGEEGGLIGCTLVLGAFGFFFYRVWLVMFRATEPFHRMLAAGILGILAFHTIVNIGMNLQLLPVVGLWLPFLSAGGTAMWLCLACVGLLLNIRSRERPILF